MDETYLCMQAVKRMVRSQNQKYPATWLDLLSALSFALSLSLLSSEFWNKTKTKATWWDFIVFVLFFLSRNVWPQVQNHFWPEPAVKVWLAEK